MRIVATILLGVVCLSPAWSGSFLLSNGNHPAADFATIADALAGTADNDTIYVDGTGVTYGNFTLSAPRVFMGNGYFGQGTGYGEDAILGAITIDAAATGATFVGLTLGALTVSAESISVQRCYLMGNTTLNVGFAGFASCYLTGTITVSATSSDTYFESCIFYYTSTANAIADSGTNTVIDYCTFYDGNISLGSAVYSNCIINSDKVLVTAGSDGGGNISDVETNLAFSATTIATDADLQLQGGSTALTTSSGGSESGAFGFPTGFPELSYKLSGAPPIPVVTAIEGSTSSKEGSNLSITIQAKTNN